MRFVDFAFQVAHRYGLAFMLRLTEKMETQPADTACWLWRGACAGASDRPCVWFRGRSVYVARLVLRVKLGRPLKPHLVAAHSCDNPLCVNPSHLSEATHSRNLRDAWARGRRSCSPSTFTNEEM